MKKLILISCFLVFVLTGLAFAEQQTIGAGESGFRISLGYNGAQLNYKEIVMGSNPNGGNLDKDIGWQNGATVEARHDGEVFKIPFFIRAGFDYLGADNTKYTNLTNGSTLTTRERFYETEFDLGYKGWNPRDFTLAPYLGIGWRDWERGRDVLPDYLESYTWYFGVAGVNLAYRTTDRLLLGLDGAVLYQFSPEMKTKLAGLYDTATFNIKSRIGYRFQLPASYDVYKAKGYRIFTFLTPYYERLNIGQSPTVPLTRGGVPAASAFEPTSHTDLYGVKVGIGINF